MKHHLFAKITLVLGLLIVTLMMSCDQVLIKEPLPNSSGIVLENFPDYLLGDFIASGCMYSIGEEIEKISIWKEDYITVIQVFIKYHDPLTIRYNSRENITYSSGPQFDRKKIKLYEADGRFFMNIPFTLNGDPYWRVFVFEKLNSESFKLVTPEFNLEHYNNNKSFYESNVNYESVIKVKASTDPDIYRKYLTYNYYNEEELFLVLNDRLLLTSCVFEKE